MIGLFHSDWLGYQPGRVSYWPTAGRERDGKITIDVSRGWILQVFLTLLRQNCHVTHPPPSPPSCAIA